MRISRLFAALLPVALFLGVTGAACAGVITDEGMSFTTTTQSNTLTPGIDAAHHAGNRSIADTIAALELKGPGTFSTVPATGPAGATGRNLSGQFVVPVPAPVPADMALPEPGNVALLFGGMLAMGAFALRRRTR
jgi:hypothetical protein